MPVDLGALCEDLAAEAAEVDELVEGLAPADYLTPTPAPGWSIRDQLTHLAHFDDAARHSLTDPGGFRAARDRQVTVGADDGGPVQSLVLDRAAEGDRAVGGPEARVWWRRAWLHCSVRRARSTRWSGCRGTGPT